MGSTPSMNRLILYILIGTALATSSAFSQATPSPQQLANWLKRFPEADADKNGTLTVEEANAFRKKIQTGRRKSSNFGIEILGLDEHPKANIKFLKTTDNHITTTWGRRQATLSDITSFCGTACSSDPSTACQP